MARSQASPALAVLYEPPRYPQYPDKPSGVLAPIAFAGVSSYNKKIIIKYFFNKYVGVFCG